MSLKHIDLDSAFRLLADRRIEEAMKEGKFDNLAGRGKPIELEPMPAEENARMTWWALRIMRQNDITPHEVLWRKKLDNLREQLAATQEGEQVKSLVNQINALVTKINTLGTNAINIPVTGV